MESDQIRAKTNGKQTLCNALNRKELHLYAMGDIMEGQKGNMNRQNCEIYMIGYKADRNTRQKEKDTKEMSG